MMQKEKSSKFSHVHPALSDKQEILNHLCTNINNLAMIPDGDRRWAREQGLPDSYGHVFGFTQAAERILTHLILSPLPTITFWCNSPQNLTRDRREVLNAMDAFHVTVLKMLPLAKKHRVKMVHFGMKEQIPEKFLEALHHMEEETVQFSDRVLNIGINYSGREELVRMAKRLVEDEVLTEHITPEKLYEYSDFNHQRFPHADLVMRAGKVTRLSGLLGWTSGFSELYFVNKFFPAWTIDDLIDALTFYSEQRRNFGK